MTSCQKNNIYFDIKEQKVISCNNRPINLMAVDNDSIKPNGFLYEGGLLFLWEGDYRLIPSVFSFDDMPKEYHCTKGGVIYKSKIILKPNCRYTLTMSGNGSSPHMIKIWTNKRGIVYKTTHPKCADNQGTPEEWLK